MAVAVVCYHHGDRSRNLGLSRIAARDMIVHVASPRKRGVIVQRSASQRGRAILLAVLLVVLLILVGPLLAPVKPIEVPAFQGLPTAHIPTISTPAVIHD